MIQGHWREGKAHGAADRLHDVRAERRALFGNAQLCPER